MAKLEAGKLTGAQYDKLVNRYKPIIPYDFVPTPATKAEAVDAIREKETYGVPAKTLKTGHPVGLRLDIPAYTSKGVWVPTVHEQESGFGAGKKIGHESVAELTDATFGMHEKAAASIAGGKPKGTIATIKGNWKKTNEKTAVAKAQAALNDPAWTQVGMDPERHSYFYDRKTTQPILSADEVIQIGPLVLAKNAKFGSKKDFKYSLADATKVEQVKFLDEEIQDLVKKVGNRIAGMKSDETLEDVKKAVAKLQQFTAQGIKGKEQYAVNQALIREGFNIDPMQGVYGSAARDAAIGALTAAPIAGVQRGEKNAPKPVLEPTKAQEPEELAKQSNPNIYNDQVKQSAPEIAAMLLPEMKRFGLENVGLKIMDSIENGRADGMWANNLIHVALDKPNPMAFWIHAYLRPCWVV